MASQSLDSRTSCYIFSTFHRKGGAAIAAARLGEGLNRYTQISVACVHKTGGTEHAHRECLYLQRNEVPVWHEIHQAEIIGNRSSVSGTYFDMPFRGYLPSPIGLELPSPALINLHWVGNFLSVRDVARLRASGAPIVWTLHDQGPFTGGCHYSAGCRGFEAQCRPCPQLRNDRFGIPGSVLAHKELLFPKDITVISPSNWLAQEARTSRVFRDNRVEVIPNGVDTEVFAPSRSGNALRDRTGISRQATVILIGADDGREPRKGAHLFAEVLRTIAGDTKMRHAMQVGNLQLLTFGKQGTDFTEAPIRVRDVGHVRDGSSLNAVYAAADLFVLPSLEDNLPNTVLESMSSGTPVIAFRVGGVPDMITHNQNGLLCRAFDIQEMAAEIVRFYGDPGLRRRLSGAARERVVGSFTLKRQALRYASLFKDVIALNGKLNRHGFGVPGVETAPEVPLELSSVPRKHRGMRYETARWPWFRSSWSRIRQFLRGTVRLLPPRWLRAFRSMYYVLRRLR